MQLDFKNNFYIATIVWGKEPQKAAKAAKEKGCFVIEARVDLFSTQEPKEIAEILKEIKKNSVFLILTIRRKEEKQEGGFFFDEKERYKLYSELIQYADIVDIELRSGIAKKVIKLAKEQNKKIILSYHNWRKTPSIGYLSNLCRIMRREYKVDICKVATYARNKLELFRLLDFSRRCRYKPLIAISLGSLGKISRLLAPLYGSCLTYASLEKLSDYIPLLDEYKENLKFWYPNQYNK